MDIKRIRVLGKKKPSYPDVREVNLDRRAFLKRIGSGLLGVSILGLGACEDKGPEAVEPDLKMGDLGGVVVDIQETEEWEILGGIGEPDAVPDVPVQLDWTTGGVAPPPDEIGQDVVENVDVKPDGSDVPPLPGEAPAPDMYIHPDVGQDVVSADVVSADVEDDVAGQMDVGPDVPPLAGDMAIPRRPRKR